MNTLFSSRTLGSAMAAAYRGLQNSVEGVGKAGTPKKEVGAATGEGAFFRREVAPVAVKSPFLRWSEPTVTAVSGHRRIAVIPAAGTGSCHRKEVSSATAVSVFRRK